MLLDQSEGGERHARRTAGAAAGDVTAPVGGRETSSHLTDKEVSMKAVPNRTRGLLASAALFASGPAQTTTVDNAYERLPEAKGPGSVSGAPDLPAESQNQQRKTRRLALPVLAIGGEKSSGAGTANTMKLVADDVQTVVISRSGHRAAEEAPEQLLAAPRAFLAPYRDGLPSAR